jgi:3-oxoacyl-[acyl-carrier protein] reductase
MNLQLKGLRALVTGGTRGIGRAIAETLVNEGASVAFCARNAAEVNATSATLSANGSTVIGSVLDVSHADSLNAWVSKSAEDLGGIDIVVANVSAWGVDADEASWRKGFDVDIMGTVRLVNAAMPYLENSDHAAIVTLSSIAGRDVTIGAGPYGAVKAALVHYTKGLAYQLAAKGIRANSVSPGHTYFPGGAWSQIEAGNPAFFKVAMDMIPMGRMATPQEIATAVVFLASPVASFVTGTNLVVDGALTRGVQL